MSDIAKGSASCTDIPHDHKCSDAVTKAFSQIGAGGFFADGMQTILPQNGFKVVYSRVIGSLGPYPFRFTCGLRRRLYLYRDAGNLFSATLAYWAGLAIYNMGTLFC